MKYRLTIEAEFDHELRPFVNAEKNQNLIENIYSRIFRPVLKHSENEEQIKYYEEIWQKISLEISE